MVQQQDKFLKRKKRRKTQKSILQNYFIFPFDLFPAKIVIDASKVSVVMSSLFYSARVYGVPVENIGDVFVDTGLFFATLRIVDRDFPEKFVEAKYLKRKDTLKIRRIIQGLVIAEQTA